MMNYLLDNNSTIMVFNEKDGYSPIRFDLKRKATYTIDAVHLIYRVSHD